MKLLKLLKVELVPNDTGTSQSQYEITLSFDGDIISLVFLDCGNNAEYQSKIDAIIRDFDGIDMLEILDQMQSDLIEGNVFTVSERGDVELLKNEYLAFNPIELSYNEALKASQGYTDKGLVVVVSKGYGSEEHNVRVVPFRDNRANSYGPDLYLYQIGDKPKHLDCGGFS